MEIRKNLTVFGLAASLWAALTLTGCGESTSVTFQIKPGGLAIGDKAAEFKLLDQNGKLIKSSDVQPGWYTVMIFYRGRWCMACQNQLLNLKQDINRFASAKITLAAVSTDPVEEAAIMNQEWRIPFPLLSDQRLHLIDAYGLRLVDGHDGKDISKPAVIIVDPQKTVRYKYVGKSPIDRPSNDEILFLVKQMQTPSGKP